MQVDTNRREFISLLAGAGAWPLATNAQQAATPVVGFLGSETAELWASRLQEFRQGLAQTGFSEGNNVTIEPYWGEGQYARMPTLAADLVRRKVAVIVASDNAAALAAKQATTTIPIVFTTNGEPMNPGLVSGLNRPGGNVTCVGFFSGALAAKRLSLLRELVPKTQVVALLLDPKSSSYGGQRREAQETARASRVKLLALAATSEREIDTAFAAFARQQAGALIVAASPYFSFGARNQIIASASRIAIPAIYPLRDWAIAGGLMSYGTVVSDTYRQLGVYSGKILKGAAPTALPIEQSTRFELVINQKTAEALGLSLPPSLRALADEVIE
jgi:putative ABC transport system substrate-binding protein